MPTDAQVEKARSIFNAAKQNKTLQPPETISVLPPEDKSSASTLLADMIARDQETLRKADALPKYPRNKGDDGSQEDQHAAENTTPASSQGNPQEPTGPDSQSRLPSGPIQEIHKVAAQNTAEVLNNIRFGTKPKTAPRNRP